jgi:transcription elongation GreA/GreB family factor
LIAEKITAIEAELRADPDAHHAAWLRRDLRYWRIRHATAQLTEPLDPASHEVTFGSRVTILREAHGEETIEIVGEDESEPHAGRVSWVAPLSVALMGATPGETVCVGGPQSSQNVDILAVDNTGY